MHRQMSPLRKNRADHKPKIPSVLQSLNTIEFEKGEKTSSVANSEEIQTLFPKTYGRPVVKAKAGDEKQHRPLRIGVVFSGGQASGGHNVISGLFDAMQTFSAESELFGFLGGPSGIVDDKAMKITQEVIAPYRNLGGFDLIGSGRTKIETQDQLKAALDTAKKRRLDGLVIIGGDDSNTNAAVLAEFFLQNDCTTTVVGVPKTIDGDLKNEYIATSFGFDTATKTYAEMIGNIERDALSAKKYYHFIKLMGRSASHIALECALSNHPNLTLIGEEVAEKKQTLAEITTEIADLVEARAKIDKHYGAILIPEGLIEFIPEVKVLIEEVNGLAAAGGSLTVEGVMSSLSGQAKNCFEALPSEIQEQFLLDRDPHGNVQVSRIETEKLLIAAVEKELKKRNFSGSFSPLSHFFGYEGRAGYPSNFDTRYCYALGHTAALLVENELTGYMACVEKLELPAEQWTITGLPITMLMNMEMRKGKNKPVIQKALVDLNGPAFAYFTSQREEWALEDQYRYPGPIQFFGEAEVCDTIPLTLKFEAEKNSKKD